METQNNQPLEQSGNNNSRAHGREKQRYTKLIGVKPKHVKPGDITPKGAPFGVVGAGTFIGLLVLFNIPIIGWVICIIMAFAAKNHNIRNLARAVLIYIPITIGVVIAAYYAINWIIEAFIIYSYEYGAEMSVPLQDYLRFTRYFPLVRWGDVLEMLLTA